MTPAEQQLRQFLGLTNDAELSPVTRKLLTQYLDLPDADFRKLFAAVPTGLQALKERDIIPAVHADPLIHYTANHPEVHKALYDQLFLVAAGSQLAFDAMTPDQKTHLRDAKTLRAVYEGNVIRGIDKEHGFTILYAHTDTTDDTTPGAVIATLGSSILFTTQHIFAHQPTATQTHKDRYTEQVRLALHAGAEETLHALQHHDPKLKAELEAAAVTRYGTDWQNERERQFLASRSSPETIKTFSAQDPWEMDVDPKMGAFEHRIQALTQKFQSAKIVR